MNLILFKKRILERLEERKITIHKAEKMAGLGTSSLRNFLHQRTRAPTLETFFLLVKYLEIDLRELVAVKNADIHRSVDNTAWSSELTYDIMEGLKEFSEQKDIQISVGEAVRALIEIYSYCHHRKSGKIDKDFLDLFLENFFKNKQNSI